jgi:hypothetical protein
MDKLERLYIFWIVFGTLFGFLFILKDLNYLTSDLSTLLINIHRGILYVGFTFVSLLVIVSMFRLNRKVYK